MPKVGSWAGLDVHARSVLAVTMNAETGELRSTRLAGETAKVVAFCAGLPGPTRVAYEAGPTGYGLARALEAAGRQPAQGDAGRCQPAGGAKEEIAAAEASAAVMGGRHVGFRSSVQSRAVSWAPAEWPMTNSRFGSPPCSAMWSCTQPTARATSRTMVALSTAGSSR